MDEVCQECGATISPRAKANVWNGEKVVCTACLKKLQAVVRRQEAAVMFAGKAHTPWLVNDGKRQHGPYTTAELIDLLRSGRVDWAWDIWREGIGKWTTAGLLFTIPHLTDGRLELRDHGQGDGTYRFADQIGQR